MVEQLRKCIKPNPEFVDHLKKCSEKLLNPTNVDIDVDMLMSILMLMLMSILTHQILHLHQNKYKTVINAYQKCGYTDYHEFDSHPLSHKSHNSN